MDGILQFLLIAGIIVIGVVKQFKKEAKKNAENRPAMPVPENDIDEDALPIPEAWGKTYGGFIPEGPTPKHPPLRQQKKNINSQLQNIFLEEILQIHLPSIPQLLRNRRFLLLRPLRKNLKPIPNTPFIRQKKRGKPSFGRKYYNGSINTWRIES